MTNLVAPLGKGQRGLIVAPSARQGGRVCAQAKPDWCARASSDTCLDGCVQAERILSLLHCSRERLALVSASKTQKRARARAFLGSELLSGPMTGDGRTCDKK